MNAGRNKQKGLVVGDHIDLIVGEMREGFKAVRKDIEISRTERHNQIEQLHQRINVIMRDGIPNCAAHKEELTEMKGDIATLTTYMIADKVKKMESEDTRGGIFGELKYKKLKLSGLVALAAVILIGLCLFKWGPDLMKAAKFFTCDKTPGVVKMESGSNYDTNIIGPD